MYNSYFRPKWKQERLMYLIKHPTPSPQRLKNRNSLIWFKYVLTALHVNCMMLFDKDLKYNRNKWTHEWNSVVIKDHVCDVELWKNFNVYYKWDWNKTHFDINSVVFHFGDFNYGRRTATRKKWTPEWNIVVFKNHVRDA